MRIACLSDLHGRLPAVMPACDVIAITGDIAPDRSQRAWAAGTLRPWLEQQHAEGRRVVAVAGNHDFWLRNDPPPWLAWTYLQDSGTIMDGVGFWGCPWSLPFRDDAFNAPEAQIASALSRCPHRTDVLLSHGPPHGVLDRSTDEDGRPVHAGSRALADHVARIEPKLCVFGHIHGQPQPSWITRPAAGGRTVTLLNAAQTNGDLPPAGPFVFDLGASGVTPVTDPQPARASAFGPVEA